MMNFNVVLIGMVILHLISGKSAHVTQKRSDLPPPYGTRVQTVKPKEYQSYYENPPENVPTSAIVEDDPNKHNFYDPSYGFSQESIAAVISQDRGPKDTGETVLPAYNQNTKDYYSLYNHNYGKNKINDKNRYFGKGGYQYQPQNDFEISYTENKNYYSPVNQESPEYNKLSDYNNHEYRKGDKREQIVNSDPYYAEQSVANPDVSYKSSYKYQRPNYVYDQRTVNINEQYVSPFTAQRKPQVNDEITDRQRSLADLLEESKVLSEQIQRFRIRAEKELNAERVRQIRGIPFPRWYRA